jgi:hypothetical protein
MPTETTPAVCSHGSLRRSCEICERDAEIERLSRELLEAREALKRIANVVGEDEPSIMWPWAQEVARSVLSPKPAETER